MLLSLCPRSHSTLSHPRSGFLGRVKTFPFSQRAQASSVCSGGNLKTIRFGRMAAQKIDPAEAGKRAAGYAAVAKFVQKDSTVKQRIGIGSGSTVVFVAKALGELKKEHDLDLECVPTSFQAKQLIIENDLNLRDLNQCPELDLCFDGADEIDSELNLIKGGGGCHLQEKLVASAAKRFIVVADDSKISQRLGEKWKKGIPLEVSPAAFVLVDQKISGLGGKANLRMASRKAGPVVTDNGNFVLDADFGIIEPEHVKSLDVALQTIPGVLETGIFCGMAERAIIGDAEGQTTEIAAKNAVKAQNTELFGKQEFLATKK